MRKPDLCMVVDGSSSVAQIVKQALKLLKQNGFRELADEMRLRVDEAKSTEEVLEILDEYVELV